MEQVTHKEIYDRLVAVETKVDQLHYGTVEVVNAFEAAKGAFKVLELLARIAKPILWAVGLITAAYAFIQNIKVH
ncbi:hypothetical protein [Caudoviricetes sp.]|nr:hypothetical protein [Caudoviricetes sp.]